MKDTEDVYDEVSTLFIQLNEDIKVLNRNQDRLIQFMHDNLQK